MSVTDVNYFLALGTIFLQLVSIVLLVVFVMRKRTQAFGDVAESVGSWGLWIVFGVTLIASILTLYYSDVLGFEPCPLCWWQRIFLFPQVVLVGLAAWKKDAYMAEYSIILSVFGAGVALYQHILQMMPGSGLPCPATGVSCSQRILFEFSYITFPLIAFSLFVFLVIVMLFVRSNRK
jgi:disulfide bond formation protein DsbB